MLKFIHLGLEKEMKLIIKSICVASALALMGGCSTIKTLKAPCGPTAGMTDACGNRTPLNGDLHPDFGKNIKPLEADI